jgi:hypothetical protein
MVFTFYCQLPPPDPVSEHCLGGSKFETLAEAPSQFLGSSLSVYISITTYRISLLNNFFKQNARNFVEDARRKPPLRYQSGLTEIDVLQKTISHYSRNLSKVQ